jgi:hypothetical protein
MVITKEDLNDWHNSPVTREIIKEIKREQQAEREKSTLMATADETAMGTARKEGYIAGIGTFLDTYDLTLDEVAE